MNAPMNELPRITIHYKSEGKRQPLNSHGWNYRNKQAIWTSSIIKNLKVKT